MRHRSDLEGLKAYLVNLGLMPQGASLVMAYRRVTEIDPFWPRFGGQDQR